VITFSADLLDDVRMRPLAEGDAEALCRAYVRNQDNLRRWDPRRDEVFFTVSGQRGRVRDQLREAGAGRLAPWVLVRGREVVGAVTLSNVSLGPFRSGSLGYWVDVGMMGRGLATAAAGLACRAADEELGLHRLEAGTLLGNVASQRVLAKCDFEEFGVARSYLHIDGEWRDFRLFQRILNNRPPW
jgi:ribosomal-protein-alanine N-acetyltransferase